MRKKLYLALGASAVSLWAGNHVSAQTTQTWNTNTAGSNWSVNGNWNPSGGVSGNDLIFGDAFGETANSTTVGNIVDSSVTVNSLTYNNTGTTGNSWQVTQISSGVTLTLNAATAPSSIFIAGNTATTGRAAITGSGTLTINEPTSNILIGTTAANTSYTLTMSGLSAFNATASVLNFGSSRGNGKVTLADSNSITASTLNLGTSATSTGGGTTSDLVLGATNTLNIDTINVGLNFASGTVAFRSGLTNPTVTIRGSSGGTSRADFTVGNTGTTALSNTQGSSADFSGSGGSIDARFNNLLISRRGDNGSATTYTNSMTVAKGTVDATSVVVGQSAGTGVGTASTTGNLNISGGTFTAG